MILLLLHNELRHLPALPSSVAHEHGVGLLALFLAQGQFLFEPPGLSLKLFQLRASLLPQNLLIANLHQSLRQLLLRHELLLL